MSLLWVVLLLAAGAAAQPSIAITHVTAVDVDHGALRPDQTVVVQGNRIAAAGDAARVPVPMGSHIVDGRGKFLMPGMWDMHVHELPDPHAAELFIANGVTGVRDMYDNPVKMAALRKSMQERRASGPRVFASGRVLNGVAENDHQIGVHTAAQAREAVRQQIQAGVDFIKIYNGLSREAFYAIAAECKRQGIPFAGHTSDSVTTAEAAAAGQRSIEHLDGVLLDCSREVAWLRRSGVFVPDQRMLDSFDPLRAARLFATFVRCGTWHCPTLSIYQSAVFVDDPAQVNNRQDPKLARFLPNFWLPHPAPHLSQAPLDRAIEQRMMQITAMMFRAGVPLLAGTDTGAPYVLPGFGLHDELELLVAAGLPVRAVLRIATLAPAEFLGRTAEFGSLERGKLADLVLLDRDPCESIRNTRFIHAVVANGRWYERQALDNLLRNAGAP